MTAKIYEPDPIPAECIDEIAPALTDIVNDCLSTGSVPDSLKNAITKPLLKEHSLDPNILKKNFIPVSKLSEKNVFFLNCLYTSNARICGMFFNRRIDRGTAQ